MTDEQVKEMDDHLAQFGWRYNAGNEWFEMAPTADKDAAPIEIIDVLIAMPYLCMNDIEAYEDKKQTQWHREQANKSRKTNESIGQP